MAYIKRVANGLRSDLRLSLFEPVAPLTACEYLGIPVLELTAFSELPEVVRHFSGPAQSEFSAVTSFMGSRRFFVVNDTHHPHRQTSSIAHEIGHALLQHPPARVLAGDGTRDFDSETEEQAAFFGGALLVPDEACRWIMKERMSLQAASRYYGVSESMVDYRLNKSGARMISRRKARA
jgi:Zn-dependent peptidase ImmA (M78 family)